MNLDSASTIGIPSSIGSYATPRNGIVAHYIGGNPVTRGSHSNCRSQVRSWHNYHKNGNGWAGIGYNWLICHHGVVMEGRGLNRRGAHAPGANTTYQGVCFMLGGNQSPTSAQLKGFRDLRSWLRNRGVGAAVRGHRDFSSTSCPGNRVYGRTQSMNWGSGGSTGGGSSQDYWDVAGIKIPTGSPLLGNGDSGTAVERLQEGLLQWNSGLLPEYGADGDFGDETESGLRTFQSSTGLSVDGIYGPNAASKLRDELEDKDFLAMADFIYYSGDDEVSYPPGEEKYLRFNQTNRGGANPVVSFVFSDQKFQGFCQAEVEGPPGTRFDMRVVLVEESDSEGWHPRAHTPTVQFVIPDSGASRFMFPIGNVTFSGERARATVYPYQNEVKVRDCAVNFFETRR